MARVEVKAAIDAPVEAVWALLRDFGNIKAWAPDAKILKLEGEGVGATRTVEAGDGGIVVEECLKLDDARKCFRYAITESPWPVFHYRATVQLDAIDSDRCGIVWTSEFECAEAVEPRLVEGLEKLYRDGFIATLQRRLARRRSSSAMRKSKSRNR